MAITAATKQSDFAGFIKPELAAPIFEEAAKQSVVQSPVERLEMGPSGVAVPVVTGRPSVGWVGEGEKKPATKGSMSLRTVEPKKAAAIVVVSSEVVRANPGGYVTSLNSELATAFAKAFDLAALHGKAADGTTSGPFDNYVAKTSKSVEIGTTTKDNGGIYGDLVAALRLLTDDKKRLTGWAFDDMLEPDLLGAVDNTGRPLFVDLPTGTNSALTEGRLMRRPVFMGEGVGHADSKAFGFGGNWSKARWGVVGGISFDVSTQATVTINGELVSLWENNLTAIRAEAEYGFILQDDNASDFVKLVNES